MASQALYLKWRPQQFEDVVGQEHVTTTLRNALRGGRISHAYLFSGPRGTGKTTMARLLAKAVNCLDADVNARPCNQCHICRSVNEGRLLDLIEMDAASHTGVDNVREAIRDKVGFRPSEARFKVYVIDEVHMLSTSAFNALLKTLEEPPEHVIFCLATTEPHRVLPTILSRCQHFEFHRIPLAALTARLRHIADEEGLQVEDSALQFMARTSSGCARDAISLLDQLTAYGDETVTVEQVRAVLGLGDEQEVFALLGCLAVHEVGEGLDIIHRVVEHGADVRQFTQQVVDHLRLVLLLRVGGQSALPDLLPETRAQLEALAEQFSTRDVVRAIKLLNQARLDLRGSDQGQLALELAYVEAALEHKEPSEPTMPPAVAQRAERERVPVPAPPARQAAVRPAAPRRAVPAATQADEDGVATRQADTVMAQVSEEEVRLHWAEIRHRLRQSSRQVEALVNSSTVRGIEGDNLLVLEFASQFLSDKLGKEENKQIVERAVGEVLGKRCRVRAAVRTIDAPEPEPASSLPPTSAGGVEDPGSTEGPLAERPPEDRSGVPDPYEEAASDPIVQDLVDRGGQVTDVQVLHDAE